jgi:hypothetical protein
MGRRLSSRVSCLQLRNETLDLLVGLIGRNRVALLQQTCQFLRATLGRRWLIFRQLALGERDGAALLLSLSIHLVHAVRARLPTLLLNRISVPGNARGDACGRLTGRRSGRALDRVFGSSDFSNRRR